LLKIKTATEITAYCYHGFCPKSAPKNLFFYIFQSFFFLLKTVNNNKSERLIYTIMFAADFEPGGLADWVASETPIKRWIEPEEVAEVSLFLASGKASAMQGQILTVDGGWSLK